MTAGVRVRIAPFVQNGRWFPAQVPVFALEAFATVA